MRHHNLNLVRNLFVFAWVLILLPVFSLKSAHAFGATQTISLTAYTADGTNTGTARLGGAVSIIPTVRNATNTTVTWTLTGAGSVSTAGRYTSPATMPSNPNVTVTATLVENTAVTASYSFTLINPVPAISSFSTSPLSVGGTNSITISGSGFLPGTVIQANGTTISATYQSYSTMTAQLAVAGTATGSISLTAQNATPGGGTSAVFSAPIATPTITLTAYNADGTNTGTARLGARVSLVPVVKGAINTAITWTVASGSGSVDTSGYYTAPATMPSSSSVTVKASLTCNSAITASYTFSLINPIPAITSFYNSPLSVGGTNSITVKGSGFVPGTVILANGTAVSTTYQSYDTVTAQVPVSGTATGSISLTSQNATPGGGTSAAFAAPVATPTISLTAYNGDGTNTATGRLGARIHLIPTVSGTVDTTVNWSVTSGAGSVDTTGYYTAPQAMPSSSTVVVTGALNANPAIKASYTFSLINPVPIVSNTYPTQVKTNMTNSVSILGESFVAGTQVYVNGTVVPTTFVSFSQLTAQITVTDSATSAFTVTAVSPTPGGGTSNTFSLPILPKTIQLDAYNSDGIDTGTARLGLTTQLYVSITNGTGSTAATWTLQGAGTLSSAGLYQAPSTMPGSTAVTVTAALVSNPAVKATYSISLLNPVPVIDATSPSNLTASQANTVTISGSGFVSGTSVLVNGTAATTTYVGPDSVKVSITPASGATSVTVAASNPAPGAATSSSFVIPVGTGTTVPVTIGTTAGQQIPLNFLGLSHEWGDAQGYLGCTAYGVNTIYRQLLKNLMNGQSYPFEIRVGGGSTDATGEPTASTIPPFAELFQAMGTHFTLGVNLGQNNVSLAVDQATAYAAQMPSGSIDAIEIGNEPDNYATNGYRTSTYTIANYFTDYATWRSAILPVLPTGVKMMGPAWSELGTVTNIPTFAQNEGANTSIFSYHFYAGHQYGGKTFTTDYLLQPTSSTSAASMFSPYVATVHQAGSLFRVGEMNSIDTGGVVGISDAFGSALWAIDSMFELAKIGVDGVNWHGASGCTYCAFTFAKAAVGNNNIYTLQEVSPLYYGMLFFQYAAGNNAKMLPVTLGTTTANIKVWATVDLSNVVHVAILNKDKTFAGSVSVTLSGRGSATAIRLTAPSYQSTNGVSIGGQTFDGSIDGNIVGTADSESITPVSSVYSVSVQPTSAVLLTIK